MAKMKGKGVVIAGLIAGAASFLSKKENRDKLNGFLNNTKGKDQNFFDVQKLNLQGLKSELEPPAASGVNSSHGSPFAEADPSPQAIEENEMMSEGGTQQVFNEFDKNR